MKLILLILSAASLMSCSHAYVRHWGGNQVTTCCPQGNLVCSNEKLGELAEKSCKGPASPIGGGLVESGAQISKTYGGAEVRSTSDVCVTYQCGRSPASK